MFAIKKILMFCKYNNDIYFNKKIKNIFIFLVFSH